MSNKDNCTEISHNHAKSLGNAQTLFGKKNTPGKIYWKTGDVYVVKPTEACTLKNIVFLVYIVDGERYEQNKLAPLVRVKITNYDNLPQTSAAFNLLEYVQISAIKPSERFHAIDFSKPLDKQVDKIEETPLTVDAYGMLPEFLMILLPKSNKVLLPDATFLANFPLVNPPKIEYIPHNTLSIPMISWKFFESIIIRRYEGYNLGKFFQPDRNCL